MYIRTINDISLNFTDQVILCGPILVTLLFGSLWFIEFFIYIV